jgi:peroxin-19
MASNVPKENPAPITPLEQVHQAPELAKEAAGEVSQASKEPEVSKDLGTIEEPVVAKTSQPSVEPTAAVPAQELSKPTPAVAPPPASALEEAPDPDEDDLSDLDDVLDEFAATNLNSKSNPILSGPGRPSTTSSTIPSDPFASLGADGSFPDNDEFAWSLEQGMAELLGDMDGNPEMQEQFKALAKEMGLDAMPNVSGTWAHPTTNTTTKSLESDEDTLAAALAGLPGMSPNQTPAEKAKAEASFQETIRATMERMNASSASATEATSSSAANPDDFLSAMLAEMEKGGGDPSSLLGGAGGDEDFSKLLLGMMEQLTNKDILYEPMKELHDKFPAWMEVNKEICPKADLDRYLEQQRLVGEITGKFEEAGYADSKVEDREYIVDRMQKVSPWFLVSFLFRSANWRQMQAAGSPPPDLVGDMNAAQEALDGMDQGCAQQ